MTPLVEKFKPATLDAFAGLDRPRAILKTLAARPYSSAWLFIGASGTGKTTMALALASAIGGQVHHIPSRKCDLATVDAVCHDCLQYPMLGGKWHIVIVDEADQMTPGAQLAFLSKLDTTAAPPDTIFIFTANDSAKLQDRFLSRVRKVVFSREGLIEPAVKLLAKIWQAETTAPAPDFRALIEAADCNIRAAIMELELELLMVPQPETTIDADALALRLKIDKATIYRRVKSGTLPQPIPDSRPMAWMCSAIEAMAAV